MRDDGEIGPASAFVAVLLACTAAVLSVWPACAGDRGVLGHPSWGMRRLTTVGEDGLLTDAALSPDGRRIAYVHASKLWVREVDGAEATPVQLPAELVPAEVDLFADGHRVLVSTRGERSELGVVTIDSGARRRLASACRSPRISPDGDSVACARGPQIVVVSVSTGAERVLCDLGAGASVLALAWSPSGGRIAYVRSDEQARRWVDHAALEVVNADGTSGRKPFRSMMFVSLFGHAAIAWISEDALLHAIYGGRDPQLREVSLTGDVTRTHSIPGGELLSFRMAHQVGRLMFLRRTLAHDVYLVDTQAGAPSEPAARRITHGPDVDRPMTWMPDGRLAFVSNRGNRDRDFALWALAPGRGEPETIVEAPVSSLDKVQFDGDTVYFARASQSIVQGYVRRNLADGSERRFGISPFKQCTRTPPIICLGATRDGPREHLHMVDPQTESRVGSSLEHPSAMWRDYALSPDGRLLAMVGGPGPVRLLVTGSWETHATAEVESAEFLAWSHDGNVLYVTERPNDALRGTLHEVARDGTHRPVWSREGAYVQNPVPSPDGESVAVAVADTHTDVWIFDGL